MNRSLSSSPAIHIRGARTHNLKDVSVTIPIGSVTVITGVSGSGKSSLAFDTLYAEGQRRYAESLSTYARQFLERLDRPDVDAIEPVPPAIALEQKNGVRNARSTVGTQTEIYDSLRLLFAHGGTTFCPACGVAAVAGGVDRAVEELFSSEGGARVTLVAPLAWRRENNARRSRRTGREDRVRVEELKRAGFFRALSGNGETVEIAEDVEGLLDARWDLPVVVGRFVIREESRAEIAAAADTAFAMAGSLSAVFEDRTRTFRRGLHCPGCGADFRDPTPALFAFNSPLGACPACQGFGRVIGVDLEKVIPDTVLTLSDRPIAPWNTPAYESAYRDLFRACRRYSVRTDIPVARLSAHEREVLIKGRGEFYGINGFFDWLETKRYKIHVRVLLARYRAYTLCPECRGARLTPAALSVRLRGRTIAELSELPLSELQRWFEELALSPAEQERLSSIVSEIRSRVRYMNEVGLDYLTLSRAARTLSGGESQRIGLASALGGALTGTLYVLDEPTIGLHAADTRRLLTILRRLADRGNTVVVVEHDPEVIEAADRVIDLGPGAGSLGGHLLFEGAPRSLARVKSSATGELLRRRNPSRASHNSQPTTHDPPAPPPGRIVAFRRVEGAITIVGAREHNLKDLTVRFPLGRLAAVSGVSGSGKSTLVRDILYNSYARRVKGLVALDVGAHDRIDGLESVSDVLLVDQSPLGRSARSNPVTYVKAWDEIRQLFARTARAVSRGITARDFSFNSPGGRCEVCRGTGWQTIDMQFLADVIVRCDACDGRRFQNRVLAVRYRGKNIGDVLALTVVDASAFFADQPKIVRRLQPLKETGLGYVTLGQPTATLSGGEAQRLKLASFLDARAAPRGFGGPQGPPPGREFGGPQGSAPPGREFGGPQGSAPPGKGFGGLQAPPPRPLGHIPARGTLFLFDEPTTGLHASDIERLLQTLRRLILLGHSVIAIEHNLQFLAAADWIVDLGPGGGDRGGRVVAEGPPEEIRRLPASLTGRFLAELAPEPSPEPREAGMKK